MPPRAGQAARTRRALLLSLPLTLSLGACLPVPDIRIPLQLAAPVYRVDPAEVAVEMRWWRAPPAPETPPELDRTGVRRTHHPGTPASVIVIAMPGLRGGAASFDPWARQLVATRPGLEVWAIDRRSNQLEDRTGIERALRYGDPSEALRYYYGSGDRPPDYTQVAPDDVRFLAHWGLDVHLRDLHVVVLQARAVGAAVVLAGHSLGASMVSVYAAYRVPPEEGGGSGQDYVDALVLLDGTIGRTGAYGREDRRIALLGLTFVPSIPDLLEGRSAPFLTGTFGVNGFVRHKVVSVYALLDPEGTAPPQLSRFPISNLALAGVISDDEYVLVPGFGVSAGHAVDAAFSGNLTAFILTGTQGARSRTVIGVAPRAERVEWSAGDPEREHTDLMELVRARAAPDSDVAEWYFPLRLLLDLMMLEPRLEGGTGFRPAHEVDVPTLAIGAGRGLVPSILGFASYSNTRPGTPIAMAILPGFTHIDLVMARDNPSIPIVLRFLGGLVELPE